MNDQQVAFIIKAVQVINAVLTFEAIKDWKRTVCTEISKGLSGSLFFSAIKGNTLMEPCVRGRLQFYYKERPSVLVTSSYTF